MKGLLIKDYHIFMQRKQSLLIFVAVCIIMGFTVDSSFLIGYMCVLSVIMAISTIAYDDADNGMMFLMTLPVERKTYALSKYVLGWIFCLSAWILSLLLISVIDLIKGDGISLGETLFNSLVFFPIALIMLDIMIPIQLKYGAEKSRTIMLLFFGGITALLFLGKRLFLSDGAEEAFLRAMDSVPALWAGVSTVVTSILLTVLSYRASVRIMKKKAF